MVKPRKEQPRDEAAEEPPKPAKRAQFKTDTRESD